MVAAIWSPKNGGSDEQNGSKTHSVQSYGFPKTRGAIEYRGSDSAPPKSGEVRVRIICSSLYYNDVTYWKMKDPHAYFPRILGHESFGWKVTHHLVSERFHQSANNRHENAPRPTHRLSWAFYNGKKVYEFVYGLSYSNYIYEFISVSRNTTSITQLSTTLANSTSVHYISVSKTGTNLCDKAKFTGFMGNQSFGKDSYKSGSCDYGKIIVTIRASTYIQIQ